MLLALFYFCLMSYYGSNMFYMFTSGRTGAQSWALSVFFNFFTNKK